MADPVVIPDDQDQFKLNEVCKLANVQPYMLRFWGSEFPQLEAAKSGTGQRLYTREQVEVILEIRRLLFDEGLTIAGARKKLESGTATSKAAATRAEPKAEVEKEPAEDRGAEVEAEQAQEKAPPAKAPTTTSSARRTVKKKDSKPAQKKKAAAAAEVDKEAADDVQPLLATLKSVRDEIDTIVAELKGK